MRFFPTTVDGAYLLELEPSEDERGYFARVKSREAFESRGLVSDLSESSISYNRRRATLRGMHYQAAPHEETKLVTCVGGRIFDVIVDLRKNSSSYMQSYGIELSPEKRRSLYVPAGVAHGFLTLADDSYVYYQIGGEYAPEAARGIRWDDPALNVDWPLVPEVVSERDRGFEDYRS